MAIDLQDVADGAGRVVRGTGQVAAWSGLALVLVVAGNVLGRYLFGLSSVALQEAEWHLMAVCALFGISYGLNQAGEVRVDVLYERFGPRAKAVVDTLGGFLLCLCALALAWLSLGYVEQSYAIGEGSPDPGGLEYRFLLKAALPIGFLLLALQAAAMTLGRALDLAAGPDAGSRSRRDAA